MSRRAFQDYAKPSVAVDLVLMTVRAGRLAALLQRREGEAEAGKWALPGGFVGIDESLDGAAARVLAEKARMAGAWVEQLYTFGAPARDRRGRVISVAYFALLPEERFADALSAAGDLMLADVAVDWAGQTGGPARALDGGGGRLPLAFDHADILGLAVKRLRGKLDYSGIAFALLPELFTLRELQQVHEAILGATLNKPAFRRRLLAGGRLEATGRREAGTGFRPAELFRHIRLEERI
ncbi:MAG TPA: NUDIX domain-containing protein [Allosphingosinicella sp.]|jgi:8-oxo-dGTP diphosphatase